MIQHHAFMMRQVCFHGLFPEGPRSKITAETIQALQDIPGIAGVNLQATADPELLLAAIEQSGVKVRGSE